MSGGIGGAQFAGVSATQTNLRQVDAPAKDTLVARAGQSREIADLVRSGDVNAAKTYMERNPDQIDSVLSAFAASRPGLVPELVTASGAIINKHIADQQAEPSLGNRIWGGVRALGGGIEAIVGGALVLAPEPTMLTKVGGGVMAVHGSDNFVAGFRQLWTGLPTDSMTQQGAEAAARGLGADADTAKMIGVGVDIGVGLAGSGLASLGRLANGSRLVWGSIKATQPLYEGTVIPRSFELATQGGKFWVAGNGTKHIAEYASTMLDRGVSPGLVNVASQVQLSSLQAAIQTAAKEGIVYEKLVKVGGWELIFSAPRQAGLLPVIKHALPLK